MTNEQFRAICLKILQDEDRVYAFMITMMDPPEEYDYPEEIEHIEDRCYQFLEDEEDYSRAESKLQSQLGDL